MTIRQDVVWANWKVKGGYWKALIDGEAVQGSLSLITQSLADSGWEIVSVVPTGWQEGFDYEHVSAGNPQFMYPGGVVATTASSFVAVLALFVRR
jgi:hypothetical protein